MILAIFLLLFSDRMIPTPNWAMPPGFHVITTAEYVAEEEEEAKNLIESGWYGDLPITTGFLSFRATATHHFIGYGDSPAYYADGKGHFETSFEVYIDSKVCALTVKQYYWLFNLVNQPWGYGVLSEAKFKLLVQACSTGKLPERPSKSDK